MEIKILDSILHGNLKPWKLDTSDTRRLKELVKAAIAIKPDTNADLVKQLTALLADNPELISVLQNTPLSSTKLRNLSWYTDLPKYKDVVTQFYWLLITGETLRLYNTILQQAANWTELVDIRYQVGNKALINIRVLAQQASEELNERQLGSTPDDQSNVVHFALYYLKHSLIQLYFSVQEAFKGSLEQVTTLEDFYISDLGEPLSNMLQLEFIGPVVDQLDKKTKSNKFSFGFNKTKPSLEAVINQLCIKLDLINDSTNTEKELVQVLTAKDLKPGSVKITIGCETAQFRYILDCLKVHFDNLSFASVEKANIFYSKNDTLLTAQNLYSSKVANPKTKEEIDNIIKHLK